MENVQTLIVVASRIGAKIFKKHGNDLSVTTELLNPEGRLKDSEINSDSWGQETYSGRAGGSGNSRSQIQADPAVGPQSLPHEVVLQKFCKRISKYLKGLETQMNINAIILVAEPSTLGELKKSLELTTTKKVSNTIGKDFYNLDLKEIAQRIQ